jgi:hypothetical protein
MKYVLLFCLGLTALAQQIPPVTPPIRLPYPQLARYLDLTGEQQAGLARLQAEWQRYLIEKQRRVAEVERELARETNSKVPDPLSLGLRYAELEAICREARNRDSQNMQSARKLLTAPQALKLQTLEAAYALMPVMAEADQANLIHAPLANLPPANRVPEILDLVQVAPARQYPGCRYPAAIID